MRKIIIVSLLAILLCVLAVLLIPSYGTDPNTRAAMQADKLLAQAAEKIAVSQTNNTIRGLASSAVLPLTLERSNGLEVFALIVDRKSLGRKGDASATGYAGVVIDCSDGKDDEATSVRASHIAEIISRRIGRNIPVLRKAEILSGAVQTSIFTWSEITGLIEMDFSPLEQARLEKGAKN